MTSPKVLVHELPERAARLQAQCRDVLLDSDDSGLRALADQLVGGDEGPINLVFTGQYNSGKSTMIRALTGRTDIIIDSDVATNKVRAYEWGQVHLVDTPGVQAGTREHDDLAEGALRNSDLVVFVVSVDLLDDAAVVHLRHVAADLGKRPSMVVAVNKAGMLSAAPAIRVDAVRNALGPGVSVPVIITDAVDFLDAQEEPDADLRAELISTGNLQGLAAALNGLVSASGPEARLRRPFEKVIVTAADGLALLTEIPEEVAARKVLNRERRLVAASRRRLELSFEQAYSSYKRDLVALGEGVADRVEAADDVQGAARSTEMDEIEQSFRLGAEKRTDRLLEEIRRDLENEARIAAQELKELADSPQVEVLTSGQRWEAPQTGTRSSTTSREPHGPGLESILNNIGQRAGQFARFWGPAGAKGMKDYSGGAGHKLVYSVGKSLGKDFKPWEAVRLAKNIGQAANFVNKAMPYVAVGVDVFIAIRADQAESRVLDQRQARRRHTIEHANRAAEEVVMEVRLRLNEAMGQFYGPVERRIAADQQALDEAAAGREGAGQALQAIIAECQEQLSILNGVAEPGHQVVP